MSTETSKSLSDQREIWLREILRVNREVQYHVPLIRNLESRCTNFDWSDSEFQSAIVEKVLRDQQQVKFPPNQYEAASFWEALIQAIRKKSSQPDKIHPELLSKEEESKQIKSNKETENLRAGWYRNYDLADICDETTTSELSNSETDSIIVLPSCPPSRHRCYPFRVETGCLKETIGFIMWPAGYTLIEFALDNPQLFHNKRVLELGAGIGFSSIVLAKYCRPSALIVTDFDPRVVQNIHNNFKINGLASSDDPFDAETRTAYTSSTVVALDDLTSSDLTSPLPPLNCSTHTGLVDWMNYSTQQIAEFNADVIIAADTSYLDELLIPFASTVRTALQVKPNTVCYLAQAERHPLTFLMYVEALLDQGLLVTELTQPLRGRFNYDRTTCPVIMHQVTLKQK